MQTVARRGGRSFVDVAICIALFPGTVALDYNAQHDCSCELTAKRLLVDFRGVQFMSSAMIGKLVLLNKAAKQQSLDLRFANISPNVLEVFKITRLHELFRPDDDNPDLLGAGVPKPKPPSTLDGGAKSPSE